MCNFMGQERWLSNFNSTLREKFVSSSAIPWIVAETGSVAGEVRSAGGDGFTAGNVTFVTVYEAG
jgi:cathepsin A (carboxypeptidase C)